MLSTDNSMTQNLDKLKVIDVVSNVVRNVARQIKRVLDLRINLTYLSDDIYTLCFTIYVSSSYVIRTLHFTLTRWNIQCASCRFTRETFSRY